MSVLKKRKTGENNVSEKTRAYIYTRVSTAMQVEGYSLDAQKERMRTYAKSMDIEIAGEYEDAGRSGKSISGRPEFQRMINDIENQKDNVSFVLVFKLSRWKSRCFYRILCNKIAG